MTAQTLPPIAPPAVANALALLGDELARRVEIGGDCYTQASLYALNLIENVLRDAPLEDLEASAALLAEFVARALDG